MPAPPNIWKIRPRVVAVAIVRRRRLPRVGKYGADSRCGPGRLPRACALGTEPRKPPFAPSLTDGEWIHIDGSYDAIVKPAGAPGPLVPGFFRLDSGVGPSRNYRERFGDL